MLKCLAVWIAVSGQPQHFGPMLYFEAARLVHNLKDKVGSPRVVCEGTAEYDQLIQQP